MTPFASAPHPGTDPIVTEIIRNGFVAATEEMKTNLMRTAYNMIIYEALDFTVGLFDADGNTISIGLGLPMFIRGMSNTVKSKIAFYGIENIHPGDVLLTNDAYITGSHLNHMTFTVPVFDADRLIGFSACMAHWQDIGGMLNGITRDIFSEGLQMPIVKAYRRGEINEEIVAIIRMNVRVPERAMGDLRAQIAAVKTGERRMSELAGKFGADAVTASMRAIMDQSEAAARDQVRLIPDGYYEAQSYMDDDGVDLGQRVSIKVSVTVNGDEMTIDLSEVADQVKGFYNSGETAGRSAAQVAFRCITAPLDLPFNDGCFRPLDIILPAGKVISAVKPAPMRQWMTYPMTVVDTVFKALAPVIPERAIAGHHADLCTASINGRHPADGRLFIYLGGLIGGGWGAKHNEDGMSATICINDGDTHNGPSEQVEAKFPLIVQSYRLRPDSGGAGRQRGGLGTETIVTTRGEIMFNAQIDRVECRPWGLFGGLSAAGNEVALRRAGGPEQHFENGKVLGRMLEPGDSYILRSGGGGGFGSPLERDIALVEQDVRQGYVGADAARTLYGVVIDPDSGRADPAATRLLRAAMAELGLPHDHPFRSEDPERRTVFDRAPPGGTLRCDPVDPVKFERLRAELAAAGLSLDRCCS